MSGSGAGGPDESGRSRGSLLADLGLFVGIGAPLAWLAIAQGALAGSYDDDGVYLLGAQSLAEGRSYRALHLPLEPYQTKYPPLFPLILSLVMRVFPAFPANLPWLLVPGVLFGAGAAVLWRRVLRDVLGFHGTAAACIVAGSFLGVQVVGLAGLAMSELVFAFFAAAAVLAAGSRARAAPVATGFLCGLACLTRSIGIALPVGIVGWQLARRRFREAAVTAACFGLAMWPWWWWQALAARANDALTGDVSYAYDLSYARWLLPPADELWVVWQNLVQSSYFFATFLLPGAHPVLLQPLLQAWSFSAEPAKAFAAIAITWALALSATGLVAAGAVAAVRRVRHPLWSALGAYLLLVLLWPFETARFFVPVMPFLPAFALEGLALLFRSAGADRVKSVGAVVFLACSLVLLAVWLLWVRPVQSGAASPARIGNERVIALAGSAGDGRGPVAVPRGPMITLYTGRKTLRLWPLDNPLIYYPRGRALSSFYFFYVRDNELPLIAPEARAREVLGSMWRLGVRRLVVHAPMDPLATEVIREWAQGLRLPLEQGDSRLGIQVFGLSGSRLEKLLE